MAETTPTGTTFECGINADEHDLSEQVWIDPNNQDEGSVGRTCLRDTFQAAYDSVADPEYGWGVPWGSYNLQARNYVTVLGENFVAMYERRQAEYNVPQPNRVYCPHTALEDLGGDGNDLCGGFVGAATVEIGSNEASCPKCSRWVCLTCRQVHFPEGPAHVCPGPPEAETPEDIIPADWERGVDFQLCPQCGTIRAKDDNCNFIICPPPSCLTGFCFICGERAEHVHPLAHWQQQQPDGSAGCPLWGKKGADNASYANPGLLVQPQRQWIQIDLSTIYQYLNQVLAAYDPPMPCPSWIQSDISGDWVLAIEFEGEFPTGDVCRATRTHMEIPYRELTRLHTLDDYLEYDSRLESIIALIRAAAPQLLMPLNGNAIPEWPPYLQAVFNEGFDAVERPHYPREINVIYLFFLLERVLRRLPGSWSRHVPRATNIQYWLVETPIPGSTNIGRSITFATLQTDYAHVAEDAASSLQTLERMCLKTGLGNHLSQALIMHHEEDGNAETMPAPLFGHQTDEYFYNTVDLGDLQDNFERYLQTLDQDAALLPVWWTSDLLLRDTALVIRYIRDGQAVQPFEDAKIVGALVNSISGPTEAFCSYVNARGEDLPNALAYADVNILTAVLLEDQVYAPGVFLFQAFQERPGETY